MPAKKKWTWSIELWVPHTREPDLVYTYTVDEGVDKMEELCVRALADAEREHPGVAYALMGTTIHDQIVDDDDLLDNHPDHLNHHCGEECHALHTQKKERAAARAVAKAERLAQHQADTLA